MAAPRTSAAIGPSEVSPELLEPLVAVVAILGELGATAGDVPLARPPGSLRAGLVALVANISRAMNHGHGEATRLRHALATAGATTEPAAVSPGDPAVPGATVGAAWATVATVTREWREAVAAVEDIWVKVARDAEHLRDACGAAATAGATAGATVGNLAAAVAHQDKAHQELLAATRALPVASEVAAVTSEVAAHRTRVAEASAGLWAATKATEQMAVAAVETAVAGERGRRAAVAHEPLGRLVAACQGATGFYRHLRQLLQDLEATVAAGHDSPAGQHGGPEAPEVAHQGPGVPKDPMAVAEELWHASARLAKGHLLKTLPMARRLLVTLGVPDATVATGVAQRCRDAVAALPDLLPPGPR